jgi:biopolymer transport protein ExbD
MNLKPRRAEEPEVNLVSLIDVVLMLVVFFMLSSTFVEEGRLRVKLPEASIAPVVRRQGDPIVVTVTQGGGYRVNDRELINSSAATLRTALTRVSGADRTSPVVLRADARATHQAVVTAMDVLGRLGFREIDVATINSPTEPDGR